MKRNVIKWSFLILSLLAVFFVGCKLKLASTEPRAEKKTDNNLIFHDDFEHYSKVLWFKTDPSAWELGNSNGNNYLALIKQSDYEPPYRSPHNIALIDTLVVEDFILELRAQSTKEPYNHLDLCVFFGYQDPSHFYYVHLGAEADPNAHSIFIVNDSIRTSIAIERTKSLEWGTTWHDVKIVRNTRNGLIKVYFDDMEKPIMKAIDKHFINGKIGVGSFDDTGNFDEIKIYTINN